MLYKQYTTRHGTTEHETKRYADQKKTAPANAQTAGTGLLRPPSRAETSGTVAAGQENATQSLAASSALQNSNTPTWPPGQRKQTKTPQHGNEKEAAWRQVVRRVVGEPDGAFSDGVQLDPLEANSEKRSTPKGGWSVLYLP